MTHIRKSALALFLALLCSSYSNSQTVDPTTGNLTNFTGSPTDTTSVWNNAGSVGQPLTCWSYGDPGYCGPNPRVSANGPGSNSINFSYGLTDLNQIVNINTALAAGGSGIQLSGFNFGFTAKNGNGWDNGQQDYLSAYVKFYGTTGSIIESYDYTQATNQRYNWTNFNFSETFATPYATSKLSTAQYGFIGRDNNFWAGPYGPEITNVNFSLKYSVKPDPCISDPLSSATCPGYALATVKNSLLGSTVSNASATSFVPTLANAPLASEPPPPPPPPSGMMPEPQPGQLQNPGPMQGPQQGPAGSNPQSGGQAPQQAQGPAAGPSAGPAQGPEGSKPGVSTAQALSMISANAAKETSLAMSISGSAISQATQAGDKATQDAQKVATASSTQSMESAQTTTSTTSTTSTSSAGSTSVVQIGAFRLPGTISFGSAQLFNADSITQLTVESSNSGIGLKLPTTIQAEVELPKTNEDLKTGGLNPLLTSSNTGITQTLTTETKTETVKKNVQENSAAGGVSLTAMATVPVGYNAYFSAIADSAFYAPKEIYKNQRVVDNARTQRLLNGASDRVYEQMLEQQYQRK